MKFYSDHPLICIAKNKKIGEHIAMATTLTIFIDYTPKVTIAHIRVTGRSAKR